MYEIIDTLYAEDLEVGHIIYDAAWLEEAEIISIEPPEGDYVKVETTNGYIHFDFEELVEIYAPVTWQ